MDTMPVTLLDETPPRRLHPHIVFRVTAFLMPVIALYAAFIGIPEHLALGGFICAILVLTFATFPATRRPADQNGIPWYDWIAIVLSVLSIGYYLVDYENLNLYLGGYAEWQHAIMVVALLLSFEAARRATGIIIPLISAALIAYALHQGFPHSMVLTRIYVGDGGMFGTLTDVFFRYVFLFFVFGAIMEKLGAAEMLARYLDAVTGRVTAGAAKATVVGSGLMGMVMGSSSGNVAVTGSLTIPMMKQEGYPSKTAAAIETASSLGGELSPPIMGSAIFLLVAYTGTSYIDVVLISILPAILYYLPIFTLIHFEGSRDGRRASVASGRENGRKILWDFKHLAVPPFILITLIAIGYSPTYGAAGGILSALLITLMRNRKIETFKDIFLSVSKGTINFLSLGATAPMLAVILVIVLMTGIPTIMTSMTLGLAGGSIYFVMVAIFVLALVLGMGMPIVAAYMILATVAAPALTTFDIPVLTAHLFILWYTQTAAVTPPVGLASYVAASIARTGMMGTAIESMRLAFAMFLLPVFMIYGDILSDDLGARFWAFAQLAVGLVTISAIIADYVRAPLGPVIRVALLLPLIGMCLPFTIVNILSFAVCLVALAYLWREPQPGIMKSV